MGWNYRVMRHGPAPSRGQQVAWYAIHIVHYKNDSVDDLAVDVSETGYTETPAEVYANALDELRERLSMMLEALEKPVLDYKE